MNLKRPVFRRALFYLALTFVVVFVGADLAPVSYTAPSSHQLLLTEVVVSPSANEYIEMYNASDTAVDLSDVYLTDATYAPGGVFYYKIVLGAAGGGAFDDFHARFPDGASIEAGEYQTIALAGSLNFETAFGVPPTYELYENGDTPDAVPDMREAFPGSINNQGGLSNSGEVVILYSWDGSSDLVGDLDYVLWGDKAEAVDKTGVSIDGPDDGEEPSTYLPDTTVEDQDIVAAAGHEDDKSWQREDLQEGEEIKIGGNGVTGHDETSEDLQNTFCTSVPTPNAASDCEGQPPGGLELTIHEIQGAQHLSPYVGETVAGVTGLVTWTESFGFYMQDPSPDDDIGTSEAILVISGDDVSIGDKVHVNGNVSEYYPGGYGSGNLSITEITDATVDIASSGNTIPEPEIIGTGGRIPPLAVIDDTSSGDVNSKDPFQPERQGIDFYESLEGMLVQVNDAVAVGPTSRFGEIPIIGDQGDNADVLSFRGGIVIQDGDLNPERIHVDDAIVSSEPKVKVGDRFADPIVGIISYNFGNFKLLNIEEMPAVIANELLPEMGPLPQPDQLSVATYNVLNLSPKSDGEKFAALAAQIVQNLHAPDIVALQEIQDNSGTSNDGTVEADQTYQMLVDAIIAAGGPRYAFFDIAPLDNADGGAPGSNIRVGYLYHPQRVSLVHRPGGDATTTTQVLDTPMGPALSYSPGRVYPRDPAWAFNPSTGYEPTRKPLAAEFSFRGNTVFVVANHFKSKSGDGYLFGRVQPPDFFTETQRTDQSLVVNGFVQEILDIDPQANIIVLGDFNDFDFSEPLAALQGDNLSNLVASIPLEERYSYIYEGNSQTLDHILVSDGLRDDHVAVGDIVHMNVDLYDPSIPSDHEPIMASFTFPDDSIPPQPGDIRRFRGYTYSGQPLQSTDPEPDVTLYLYGRNTDDPLPGDFMMTTSSDGSGFFNFHVISDYYYDYFTLIAEVPEGKEATGAVSETGTVTSPTMIQWFKAAPEVHMNTFWFDTPPPPVFQYLPLIISN